MDQSTTRETKTRRSYQTTTEMSCKSGLARPLLPPSWRTRRPSNRRPSATCTQHKRSWVHKGTYGWLPTVASCNQASHLPRETREARACLTRQAHTLN